MPNKDKQMLRTLINILQKAIIAILAILLTLNLLMIASKVITKDELPKVFGYSQAVVLSGSMSPMLEVGDLVIYKTSSEYEIGDVIIFEAGEYFVTHRIISQTENGYITQGDANNVSDDWVVEYSQIHGKVVGVLPNYGNVIAFLKTPLGFIILIGCGYAIYAFPKHSKKKET